jgi:hypothetical protein
LIIAGSIAHSATTVDAGATLAGHGTVGDVTVLAGGILSPGGASANRLHSGNIVLDLNSHFAVQLGGPHPGLNGYDQLDVTGTVNLGSAKLNLSLIGAFHPNSGEKFEIINNDGSDAVTGTFAGLAEGGHLVAGGEVFRISYHGGDGNDVVLTALHQATAHGLTNPPHAASADASDGIILDGLHHGSGAGDWLFA